MKTALLLLISGIAWGACDSPPYANGYKYCREITIDHTKVTANQTNFPVGICLGASMGASCSANSRELATSANGGKLLNASGYDLIFTSDNAGTTPIPYDREIQNLANGDISVWVLIASLSSTVDTKIYLFYQNASVSTDQSNPNAVWDSNYLAVLHFTKNSGTYGGPNTITDSTSNTRDMQLSTMGTLPATVGTIGGAANFSGQGDHFVLSDDADYSGLPTGSAVRMIEIWENYQSSGADQPAFCIGSNNTSGRYSIYYLNSANSWTVEGTNVAASFPGGTSAGWHHIAIGLPSGQTTFINSVAYVDGVSQTLTNQASAGNTVDTQYPDSAGRNVKIGYNCGSVGAGGSQLNSKVDEARISNITRSASWLSTEYANVSSPSTFYSVGQQVPSDASAGRTIIIN